MKVVAELDSEVGTKVSGSSTDGEYMPALDKVDKDGFQKFAPQPGNLLHR